MLLYAIKIIIIIIMVRLIPILISISKMYDAAINFDGERDNGKQYIGKVNDAGQPNGEGTFYNPHAWKEGGMVIGKVSGHWNNGIIQNQYDKKLITINIKNLPRKEGTSTIMRDNHTCMYEGLFVNGMLTGMVVAKKNIRAVVGPKTIEESMYRRGLPYGRQRIVECLIGGNPVRYAEESGGYSITSGNDEFIIKNKDTNFGYECGFEYEEVVWNDKKLATHVLSNGDCIIIYTEQTQYPDEYSRIIFADGSVLFKLWSILDPNYLLDGEIYYTRQLINELDNRNSDDDSGGDDDSDDDDRPIPAALAAPVAPVAPVAPAALAPIVDVALMRLHEGLMSRQVKLQ